jgi:prepilin-type processing-associated H-X9-DG protein
MRSTSQNMGAVDARLVAAFVAMACLLALIAFFPFDTGTPDRNRRSLCMNNLKLIGLALNAYHNEFKCFPPAYIADGDGKPMHSWRVLLLPYCEEEPLKNLYKRYDFDEPWNGPNNSKLAAEMPTLYRCPGDEVARPFDTSYAAVVGPEAAWPGARSMSIPGITDGPPNTICVVEVANSGFHWMEPRDLTFAEAARGINPPRNKKGIFSDHPGGANFLFCDGSVHFLTDEINRDVLRALLTAAGGETVAIPDN